MKKTTVWILIISPLTWAIHFQGTYIALAIACARAQDAYTITRIGTLIFTLLCLFVLLREVILGWRKHSLGTGSPPERSTALDRERFLGLSRLLISSLSILAVIYTAYTVTVFRSCE